jgi:hypothetical protein
VNPKIHYTGRTLVNAHSLGNSPATFSMFNPELTDFFFGARQGERFTFGMRERGGVEIQLHFIFFGPLHPACKMFGFQLVAFNKFPLKITVNGVKTQAMFPGYKRGSFFNICPQFINIPGLAGIISGGLNTAGQLSVGIFKSTDIIGLPTMQRQGYFLEFIQSGIDIDTKSCIAFPGNFICLLNEFFFYHNIRFKRLMFIF